jgi:hypothetical protein
VHEKLSIVLRGGYVHRNPLDHVYRKKLSQFYGLAMDGVVLPVNVPVPTTAPSFSLFGMSGLGKSSAVEQTLSFFPQALRHKKHGFVQIVWLKLDCPVHGNLKDLLLEILRVIDALIGTDYRPHKRRDRSVTELISDVARIAARHYLGILVIDEIQNLIDAPGISRRDLLTFFVTLANMAKIPFAFIGTPRALSLFQTLFHSARRAGTFGSIIWEPLPLGREWNRFMKELFRYQWTRNPTVLTEELSKCLHELTQGIEALVIRLFQLTQIEAISEGGDELMPESLFKKVASTELNLVGPMLKAIKFGTANSSREFEDLFTRGLEDLGSKVSSEISLAVLQERPAPSKNSNPERSHAITSMLAMGYERAIAHERVNRVFDSDPGMTAADAVRRILLDEPTLTPADSGQLGTSLQAIVGNAQPDQTAIDALRAAGLIAGPKDQESP